MGLSKIISAVVILLVVAAVLPAEADVVFTSMSTWHLPGTPSEERWVEVHQIDGSDASAIIHISVLSRDKGQPVWSLRHVLAHMAITAAALRRSVTGPARKERMPYPEQYSEGYSQWQKLRAQGNAPICETSVLVCAHLLPR
jgi:hypothetical protein